MSGGSTQDGFLTLSDRSKDVIISGGTNIYPREVEEALLTHADVREVSVDRRARCGMGRRSSSPAWCWDRAPRSTTPGSTPIASTTIARFKRPKRYVYLDALPKNNYGKVLKTELRAMMKLSSPSPEGGGSTRV